LVEGERTDLCRKSKFEHTVTHNFMPQNKTYFGLLDVIALPASAVPDGNALKVCEVETLFKMIDAEW